MTNSTTPSINSLNQTLVVVNQSDRPIVFANVKNDLDSGLDAYAQQLTPVSSVIPAKTGQGSFSLNLEGVSNYNLIGMQPDNLFPVTNRVAVVPIDCSHRPSAKCGNGTTSYYEDLTISRAEADAMQQSFRFYQSNFAFPGTDMAIGFIKLLKTYQTDPLNLEPAINSFFQQTPGYTQCTIESYLAASTYCRHYAFAWANLQNTFTYLVFQPATDPNAAEALVNLGSVVFAKKSDAPNPADVNDRNGGYTITYQPNVGKRHSLNLVSGNLISSESTPTVSLLLSYGLKSDFTNVDTDKTPWPILIGQVDGVQVIAVGVPETPSPVASQSKGLQSSPWDPKAWAKYFSPKTAGEWAILISEMVGVAVGLGLLAFAVYKLVKAIKQSQASTGEPPNSRAIDALNARFQAALENLELTEAKLMEGAGLTGRLAGDVEESARTANLNGIDLLFERQKISFEISLDAQLDIVKTVSKYGINNPIKEATIRINEAKLAVSNITNFDDMTQVRPKLLLQLDKIQELVTEVVKSGTSSLTAEDQLAIETNKEWVEFGLDAAEDLQADGKKLVDGESIIED